MRGKLGLENSSLSKKEFALLKRLDAPAKIQDYLNKLKFDFDLGEDIDRSVSGTLKAGKTDCAGGAVLAAAALWLAGRPPLLLDLKTVEPDFDHVLALFKEGKCWGAISKTNHNVLRYREPVYASVRELVMSYFHEYFLPDGRKTLRSYSRTLNLSKFGFKWLSDGEILHDIMYELDHSKHFQILSKPQIKKLRLADRIERKAADIPQY
jgi:hypothetical protein